MYAQGNHMALINKSPSKKIMERTKLRNKSLKDRTDENKQRYSLQQNFCVSLFANENRVLWKS